MNLEYIIVKKKDKNIENKDQFISLLNENSYFKITPKAKYFYYNELRFNSSITESSTKNNDIMLIINIRCDENTSIKDFEAFDKELLDYLSNKMGYTSINRLCDEISTYYSQLSYPRVSKIEYLLRKVIYVFLTNNLGVKWTEPIPDVVKNSINQTKNYSKNMNSKYEFGYLSYADFNDLIVLLFLKYPNNIIDNNELVELIKNANDKELKDIIKKYEHKSNWDRYFSKSYKNVDLEDSLKSFYKYRNRIAHNRLIRSNDYDEFVRLYRHIEYNLNDILNSIDKIKIQKKDIHLISKRLNDYIVNSSSNIQAFMEHIRENIMPQVNSLSEILNKQAIVNIMHLMS
ncbi:MAG: hypothetical protein IKR04_05765 [Clostridia bacterium]|nr:hypothetical protein [Clostridia bacterium]